MKNHKNAVRLFIPLCVCAACYCSLGNLAGGSQVGNPATVVGRVENSMQKPVSGAKVYLLTSQFVPMPSAGDTSSDTGGLVGIIAIGTDTTQFMTVTDSTGKFEIPRVPWNVYNLVAFDTSRSGLAIRRNVIIERGTVDVGNEMLKKPGYVIFNIADSMFVANGYLAVKGTPLYQRVTAPGLYNVYVPDDTVSVDYSTPGTNVPVVRDSIKTVYVNSGDTVDLTGIPAVVINGSLGYLIYGQPTPLSPADTVFCTDSTVMFVVSGAYTNKNTAIEYQFYISDDSLTAIVTPWSTVNSYRLMVQASGRFYVSTRVRCKLPPGEIISEWSPTCAIMIRLPAPSGFVSAPFPLVTSIYKQTVDTLLLWCATGGSVSNLSGTIEYRFQWLGDTTGYHSTAWSPDSAAIVPVIPGITFCYINAQARSSLDTTIYSVWSDTDTLLIP